MAREIVAKLAAWGIEVSHEKAMSTAREAILKIEAGRSATRMNIEIALGLMMVQGVGIIRGIRPIGGTAMTSMEKEKKQVTSKTAKINARRRKFGLPEYSEEHANAMPELEGLYNTRVIFTENIPDLVASANGGDTRDQSYTRRVSKIINGLESGRAMCPLCMTALTHETGIGAIMIIVRAVDDDDIAHGYWAEFHHAVFCPACADREDFIDIIHGGEAVHIPVGAGHA